MTRPERQSPIRSGQQAFPAICRHEFRQNDQPGALFDYKRLETSWNDNMSDASNTDPRVALAAKRTTLASFRTAQALDRTTLAWVRTTLTMGSFGFGMIGFFRTLEEHAQTPEAAKLHQGAIRFGEFLVLGGVVAPVLAGISHWNTLRRMQRGEMPRGGPLAVEHYGCALCRAAGSGGAVVAVYLAQRSTGRVSPRLREQA
jgi:putative membrane protein